MKIALVIDRFDPRLGGAEQWSHCFALRLASAGHEVHVVASRFGPAESCSPWIAHEVRAGRSRIEFAEAARRRLQWLAPDVIHDTGAGWYCNVFQPHGGSRRASFEQNLLLLPPWLRPAKRRLARLLPRYRRFEALGRRQYAADGRLLVAISRMVARDFERYHDVSADRIRLVYNGVDVERFTPALRARHRESIREALGVAEWELLLLIVAHHFRLKGVPTLLRCVSELRRRKLPVRLVVVGGKPTAAPAEPLRQDSSGVTFVGPVRDTAPYYAAADVYVQPTFYDPCSLVALEALSCGLSVITSRFNGAAELLTDGVDGYTLDDPRDAVELARRVEVFLERDVRDRMGQAARQLALAHTLERNDQEMMTVYADAAGRRQAA